MDPESCPPWPPKASIQSRARGASYLACGLAQSMLPQWDHSSGCRRSPPLQDSRKWLEDLPERLHGLGYARVGVVEPGLCAPLNPENSLHRDVRGGGRPASYMCLLSESLSRVRAEAECSSLQLAGTPPSPSGSHKYLPACDWKIYIKTLSVGVHVQHGALPGSWSFPLQNAWKHAHVCTRTHVPTGRIRRGNRAGQREREGEGRTARGHGVREKGKELNEGSRELQGLRLRG